MQKKSHLKALIVTDDNETAPALSKVLKQHGWNSRHTHDAESAVRQCLREESFHLAICDMNLPGETGIALIQKLQESCPATHSVLMTGQPSLGTVTAAFKRGAIEILIKPIKPREVMRLLKRVEAEAPSYLPNRFLAEPREWTEFEGMASREAAMLRLFDGIRAAAPHRYCTTIVGEDGSGKAYVVAALHNRSKVAKGPLVTVTTASHSERRLLRILFGQAPSLVSGRAMTLGEIIGGLEQAEGGSLYINDVAALGLLSQSRLLTLIETGRYCRIGETISRLAKVRIILGTQADLKSRVEAGTFSSELYDRLQSCVLYVPPLRQRRQDISMLATSILRELAEQGVSQPTRLTAEAERLLCDYDWPGNLRELESSIQESVFGVRGNALHAHRLPAVVRNNLPPGPGFLSLPLGTKLEEIEREAILQTLRMSNGNKTQAADVLGISRRSLYDKLLYYETRLGIRLTP